MPIKTHFLIRIALVTGVSLFAAFAVFQRSRGGLDAVALDSGLLANLRYVLWALAAGAVAAALFLKPKLEAAKPAQVGTYLIVGWSFGEGVALFGTVQYYAGGTMSTMAIGLLTFVVALLLLPIPRDRT
jgi:FtsH-binding integral membrane protein